MLGVRVSSFAENGLGEPEQDANSALMELDKGIYNKKYCLYFNTNGSLLFLCRTAIWKSWRTM